MDQQNRKTRSEVGLEGPLQLNAMNPAEFLDVELSAKVWPHLRAEHFHRPSLRVFTRVPRSSIYQQISFQLIQARTHPEVVIHVGIGFDELRKLETRWRGVPIEKSAQTHLADSLSHLVPPYRFSGIALAPRETLAARLIQALDDVAIPFLQDHSDLRSAIACWEADVPFCRVNAPLFSVLGRAALGDHPGSLLTARKLLDDARTGRLGPDQIDERRRLVDFVVQLS